MKNPKIESIETYDVIWAAYLVEHGCHIIQCKVVAMPNVLFTMEGHSLESHRFFFHDLSLNEYKKLTDKIQELQELARNQLGYIYCTPDYPKKSSKGRRKRLDERKQHAADS